ncbi:MAG: META domain-containing protein [Proteobacteria bacterium]|nr:META domain-containing protein [Pseudomonadota bacterium]
MQSWIAAAGFAAVFTGCASAAELGFPFGSELRLDVNPMRGSKRVPGLEIDADGRATIDLWCSSVPGRFVVAADTVTIIAAEPPQKACPPERANGDAELLAALNAVTHWRREGGLVIFSGARTLRYRLNTN